MNIIDFETAKELRASIIADTHDLADDIRYCDTLAATDKSKYERLHAYLEARKIALLAKIHNIQDVYLRYSLISTFYLLLGDIADYIISQRISEGMEKR